MPPAQRLRFADFLLDIPNRTLERAGVAVELGSRYFDALALLVREPGALVEKQRFFDEVWGDTVVTDSALTQCIKDVRRALGDDASNPRFVRTVPGHGYRFIAPVTDAAAVEAPAPARDARLARFAGEALAGTLGGAAAGLLVGVVYGLGLAYTPAAGGLGVLTVMLVIVALNMAAGLAGGLGVSVGLAAGPLAGSNRAWTVAAAAATGFVFGGLFKMLGTDAFDVIFGSTPRGITGALEGGAIGLAVAGGAMAAGSFDAVPRWRPVVGAALATGIAGALLTAGGGRLMGGSLELLSTTFAASRIDFTAMRHLFGAATPVALGALEGALFGACVAGAIALWRGARATR
jgi:DNA-binding winged helix-turn-helix (wHTH) protein